jgi:putative ATP-dependent endonuclease of OLD family
MRSLGARLRALLQGRAPAATPGDVSPKPRILVVVEGAHDVEFLRRISAILHVHDPHLPDLAALERQGQLIFIPIGGDIWLWTTRLAALNLPEFHLYDREDRPETEIRRQAANAVDLRPNCRALVTGKRSLENYLHPEAIREVCGLEIGFTDDDPVADLLAQQLYERDALGESWAELPRRTKTRRRNRVKKWLHSRGVERMTPQRLAQRDPDGEVRSWLETIARMASGKP